MSVKFLGQFLIERGQVDADQLREALDLMESKNRTLGELAVDAGFASAEEVRRVNGVQRRRDMRFGELALQMGVLSSVELDELLQKQQEERVHLEDALVHLGHLQVAQAAHLMKEFRDDQAPYIEALAQLPAPIQDNRLAQSAVDLLPRFCMRVGRIEVKLGPGHRLEEAPDLPLVASLEIAGNHGLHLTLAAEQCFGEALASGVSGLDLSSLAAELALDSIGEFLNVLAGNIVSALEDEGFEHRVGAPRYGAMPVEGIQLDVVSNCGKALLVITPHAD